MRPERYVAVVLAGWGCHQPSSDAPICEGPAVCTRLGVLELCEGDTLVERDCWAYCMEETGDYSGGCAVVPDAADRCECEEPRPPGPEPCDPEPKLKPTCTFDGEHRLDQCVGSQRVATPCAEICGDATAVGCFYDPIADADACTCASAGDACDVLGNPTCAGDELLQCDGESWELAACPSCDGMIPCISDALGVGRCSCAP